MNQRINKERLGGVGAVGVIGQGVIKKKGRIARAIEVDIQRGPGSVVNRLTRPTEPLGSVSRANNLRFLGRSCLALLDFHS